MSNAAPPLPPQALHWHDLGDAEFVLALAGDAPSLEQARRLILAKPAQARQRVVEHFRDREGPRWLFDCRHAKPARFPTRNYFWGTAIDVQEAAEILRCRVRDPNCRTGWQELGPGIDWQRGGTADYGSSGWLVLHFWYWGLFAAAGYAMTNDPRYARVFERCWRRWQEDFPFHVDPASIARGGSFSPEHSVMRAGRRILVLTDVVHSGLLAELDGDVAFAVLKYVWFVSGHYLRLPRNASGQFQYQSGNHNLFDAGVTPYCIGMAWPEFAHSAELVRQGRATIRQHLRDSIHPDGTSVEHSSRYAWYIANMYVQAVEVARLNGDRFLAPPAERKLRRFLWTLVELSAPDGRLVPFGDCQPPPAGLQLHTYRALFADAMVEQRAIELGVDLAQGHAPAATPCADPPPGCLRHPGNHFAASGMVLVRDGTGPASSLLWIAADPRQKTGHGHLDFTSFQLWCRGVPVVFDTSGFGYRIEEIVPAERAFYYSPFGHSLLTVDELTPVPMETMGDVRRWWGSDPGGGRIEQLRRRGLAGTATCSHAAYPSMTVRRLYEFDLAGRRIDITDHVWLDAESPEAHTYRQLFHLGFGLSAAVSGNHATVRTPATDVRFSFAASAPLSVGCDPSPLAQRAATVFGYGSPHVLLAEAVTSEAEYRCHCRITWD